METDIHNITKTGLEIEAEVNSEMAQSNNYSLFTSLFLDGTLKFLLMILGKLSLLMTPLMR